MPQAKTKLLPGGKDYGLLKMRGRKPQNFLFQRQNHLYQPGWHNSDQWNTCGQLGTLSEYCSNKASTACSHQSPEEISGTGNTMLYQLSLDQNDTKMLKRNYIKEKKKEEKQLEFSFSEMLQNLFPLWESTKRCRSRRGERENGESTGTTLCKEAFWRWGCRTGSAELDEARAGNFQR